MAGSYSLQITFSGSLAAHTPIDLTVQSAKTDLTLTYAYGAILRSAAGVASKIYVQTRDGYGNNAIVDPVAFSNGIEEIIFELCNSVQTDGTRACGGGVQELGVSTILSYGSKADGSDDVAYGLYAITYFPFSDGKFLPLVRHNQTIVQCLFDTSGLTVAQDPGAAVADACILQKQIAAASSTSSRRLTGIVAADTSTPMVVNATFKEPDLSNAKRWSLLAPIIAAIIGLTVDMCFGLIWPAIRARRDVERKAQSESMAQDGSRNVRSGSKLFRLPSGSSRLVFTRPIDGMTTPDDQQPQNENGETDVTGGGADAPASDASFQPIFAESEAEPLARPQRITQPPRSLAAINQTPQPSEDFEEAAAARGGTAAQPDPWNDRHSRMNPFDEVSKSIIGGIASFASCGSDVQARPRA
jgi:hypothetical protein